MRTVQRGWLAITLLAGLGSSPSSAEATPIALRDMVRTADAALIGTVTEVVSVEDERFARVLVERSLKGEFAAGSSVVVNATPTWTCDVTHAEKGERLLLLLQSAGSDETQLPPRPKSIQGLPLLSVLRDGRGGIHVDTRGDEVIASIDASVLLPPELGKRGRYFSVEAPLATVVEYVELCLATDVETRAQCDAVQHRDVPYQSDETCQIRGLQEPIFSRTTSAASGSVTCEAFRSTVVLDRQTDTGRRLVLRRRTERSSPDSLCAIGRARNDLEIDLALGTKFEGVTEHWVLATGPGDSVSIYDGRNGRIQYKANAVVGADVCPHMIGMGRPDRTRFIYVASLGRTCRPADADCIADVRRDAGMPLVDAAAALRWCPGSTSEPAELGRFVLVDNLESPRAEDSSDLVCIRRSGPGNTVTK